MHLDYNALQFWLSAINTAGLILIGLYTWWTNRDRATTDAIAAVASEGHELASVIRGDLAAQERRIVDVEHEVRDRLRSEDLRELYQRINEINREMGEFSAALKATTEQARLHQEFLLNQERR